MLNRIRLVQALTVQIDAITATTSIKEAPVDEGIAAANKILSATNDMKRLVESEDIVDPENKTIFNGYMQEITVQE